MKKKINKHGGIKKTKSKNSKKKILSEIAHVEENHNIKENLKNNIWTTIVGINPDLL